MYCIHLFSSRNKVAQANKTATSKNTTNEKEKKHNDSSTPHTHKLFNIKFTISTTDT